MSKLKKDELIEEGLKGKEQKKEELVKEELIEDESNESVKIDNEDLIDEEKLNEIHTELIESKGKNYKLLEERFHKIFINILLAIVVVLYFAILLFTNTRMSNIQFTNYLKISSIVCLCLSLILFENTYYKDNEGLFLNAAEISGVGICTLYLLNITIKQNFSINLCVTVMISAFVLYYIIKAIYIRFKRQSYEYDSQSYESDSQDDEK